MLCNVLYSNKRTYVAWGCIGLHRATDYWTHNPLVVGSNPTGPTNILQGLPEICRTVISLNVGKNVGTRNAPSDWPAPKLKTWSLKRALAIDEKALGLDHAKVATDLNNLAKLYEAEGRYAEAGPLCKRALAIDEKALGPNHPEAARDLNNLAELYQATGRH